MAGATLQGKTRRLITLEGMVQGVGFRPWIFTLAQRLGVMGSVRNDTTGVVMDLEAPEGVLEEFLREIKTNPPTPAKIHSMEVIPLTPRGFKNFSIKESSTEGKGFVPVPYDMATCEACLKEMWDSTDRRYKYPFINCTHCGPRFSLIEDIPYDRPNTSMKAFPLCPKCHREYIDVEDRRFHAQPIACKACGPSLAFLDSRGELHREDALEKAVEYLKQGKILAIKGIGGFHLAVDARDGAAVERLRLKKRRYGKPLAVMMPSLEEVKIYCELSPEEEELLKSPRAPIVLLRKKAGDALAPGLSPGLNTLGIMLPYSSLHHLLMKSLGFPLVMTSGNISDEPLCKDEEEAVKSLDGLAEGFLIHNRPIVHRIDDSLLFYSARAPRIVRRARGYAPEPITLTKKSRPLLATGSLDKNTFCLVKDQHAILSHHIGDLTNSKTFSYYTREIEEYKRLFRVEPQCLVKDLHPGYPMDFYARKLGLPIVEVQHHHAHIAAVMAEYQLEETVLGIAYDGTGLGSDGKIWGAEFLLADLRGFERIGHLKYFPLPGGDLAVKNPYRAALGLIYPEMDYFKEYVERFEATELAVIRRQLENSLNSPWASSMGRLFDAVASLIGLRDTANYEGQGAMELEAAITPTDDKYYYTIKKNAEAFEIEVRDIIKQVYDDYISGEGVGRISAKFHNTVIEFTRDLAEKIRDFCGIDRVVLAGGCFQNRYLLEALHGKLRSSGFKVYVPSQIPINDGGISLGQAAIAAALFSRKG